MENFFFVCLTESLLHFKRTRSCSWGLQEDAASTRKIFPIFSHGRTRTGKDLIVFPLWVLYNPIYTTANSKFVQLRIVIWCKIYMTNLFFSDRCEGTWKNWLVFPLFSIKNFLKHSKFVKGGNGSIFISLYLGALQNFLYTIEDSKFVLLGSSIWYNIYPKMILILSFMLACT